MIRDAVISPCGTYRYWLYREWLPGRPCANWLMQNPSWADKHQEDATLTRILRFSDRLGFGRLTVTNMAALRSENPNALRRHPDPIGPDNDRWIYREARSAAKVVVAWGGGYIPPGRLSQVRTLLDGIPLWCLGVTKDGSPRHPLYLRADTELREFSWLGVKP